MQFVKILFIGGQIIWIVVFLMLLLFFLLLLLCFFHVSNFILYIICDRFFQLIMLSIFLCLLCLILIQFQLFVQPFLLFLKSLYCLFWQFRIHTKNYSDDFCPDKDHYECSKDCLVKLTDMSKFTYCHFNLLTLFFIIYLLYQIQFQFYFFFCNKGNVFWWSKTDNWLRNKWIVLNRKKITKILFLQTSLRVLFFWGYFVYIQWNTNKKKYYTNSWRITNIFYCLHWSELDPVFHLLFVFSFITPSSSFHELFHKTRFSMESNELYWLH